MNRLLLMLAALALPGAAIAQTVTVTTPNTVNPQGQSTAVGKTFIIRSDGTIVDTFGGSGGGGSAGDPSFTGAANSTTIPANVAMQGLFDGTNIRRALADSSGRQRIVVDTLPAITIGNTSFGATATVVTGDQSYTVGTSQPLNLTPNGRLKVGVSNAGNVNPAAQLSTTLTADLVACKNYASRATWSDGFTGSLQCDAVGNLFVKANGQSADGASRSILTGTDGSLAVPSAGTAQRVVTKTSVAANTSATVCPASAVAVATTEIQVGARTGLGLSAQSLTQVERGTAATTPDLMLPAADTLYALPVGATNAITAYSATAYVAVCIQTLRP